VILPPAGRSPRWTRGGSPGTRETGVFAPGNLISEIHALCLAGGSAFGLAAASGVTAWLSERGVGVAVGPARVPIVAAAVLSDLAVGDAKAFPDEAMGRRACDVAAETAPARGRRRGSRGDRREAARRRPGVARRIGVASCAAGRRGRRRARGGQRVRRRRRPDTGALLAGPRAPSGAPYRAERALREDAQIDSPVAGAHTTLVCVATTVPFDPGSLKRVAIEAHDGIARAVRPAHTVVDGDVAFALAPAGPPTALLARLRVGAAAAHVVARAIVDAVSSPSPGGGGAG
jgi:L-aminopeptidase/D-esterase-like protein